jgi:hypothetical protein
VTGTEGEFRGIPVYIKYQPKWWFRIEGFLDDSQLFERSADHPSEGLKSGAPDGGR